MAKSFQAPCDVCTLVDGDESVKEVICCGACSAHLCRECVKVTPTNVARRTRAWLTRGIRGGERRDCR